jgi:hypothetical protein
MIPSVKKVGWYRLVSAWSTAALAVTVTTGTTDATAQDQMLAVTKQVRRIILTPQGLSARA